MSKQKTQLPSTPRGRRRLVKLANLLLRNARNKKGACFDYGDWGSVELLGQKPRMNCGTTACALGLAAISGKFPGLGFYIAEDSYRINIGMDVPRYEPQKCPSPIEVGAKYFDITNDQSYHIFGGAVEVGESPLGAKAERTVAKAILKFVKGKYEPLQVRPDEPDAEYPDYE